MKCLLFLLAIGCGTGEPVSSPPAATDLAGADSSRAITVAPAPIWFEEDPSRHPVLPLDVGGVAIADYDEDGDQDIAFAVDGDSLLLLRNRGVGDFDDVTKEAGLTRSALGAAAVVWVDVNGDGHLDLFVTRRYRTNYLFLGDGAGHLSDVSDAWGLGEDDRVWDGASFADLDLDGDLDAFIAVFRDPARDDDRWEHGLNGAPDVALRNDGDHFTNVTDEWNLGGYSMGETFGAVIFDVDGDFAPDLFVIHDYHTDEFFRNDGHGHFTLQPNWLEDVPTGLMGLDVADFDGDGLLDIIGTDFGADDIKLGQPPEAPIRFVDNFPRLIGDGYDPTITLKGWGCAFLDVDNDTDLDFIQTASFSNDNDQYLEGGLRLIENLGLGRASGTLVDRSDDVGPPFLSPHNGFGLSTGDLDGDGDTEVVVGVGKLELDIASRPDVIKHSMILWNRGSLAHKNRVLDVDLRQEGTKNVYAVGARVTIHVGGREQARVVLAGSSYLSSIGPRLRFGLGAADRVDRLKVTWPDGAVSEAGDVPAGLTRITRPK